MCWMLRMGVRVGRIDGRCSMVLRMVRSLETNKGHDQ